MSKTPIESKREKIYDIIDDACRASHLEDEVGIYGYVDQIEELFGLDAEQNATLIEQNKKLRDGLQWCIDNIATYGSDMARLETILNETE